ncbi:hypothetical protein BDK51DRAFT_39064 [Blyttiomyces helicus]|uniref:Uncharacterized protein n=1 Tax=Blyttiomyces helicus TaxID=388810 RepID=A0A4P9W981_9FUNG|nr:hypothetical protein BDK51DRAFT_39064 [Blyttiomyces helicus]|eukprot:RKO88055.1 hypothetical protein BDK51DRAFT_39064 [Blyttiomyces helicus]
MQNPAHALTFIFSAGIPRRDTICHLGCKLRFPVSGFRLPETGVPSHPLNTNKGDVQDNLLFPRLQVCPMDQHEELPAPGPVSDDRDKLPAELDPPFVHEELDGHPMVPLRADSRSGKPPPPLRVDSTKAVSEKDRVLSAATGVSVESLKGAEVPEKDRMQIVFQVLGGFTFC